MDWKNLLDKLKEHVKLVIGVGLVLILVVFFGLRSMTNNNSPEDSLVLPNKTAMPEKSKYVTSKQSTESQKSETNKQIMVDIKGAVKNPAVYKVDSHARVNDVIVLAGGLTPQADGKSVNLAQKVTDEMIIYVASVGENVTAVPSTVPSSPMDKTGATTTASSDKVNINTADLTQLQTLSGIGAKKAQDIIDYREQNGPFKTAEDLGKVSGFGEKTIEKLRESITVD